jgi:Protein of unknown function (DUF3300)
MAASFRTVTRGLILPAVLLAAAVSLAAPAGAQTQAPPPADQAQTPPAATAPAATPDATVTPSPGAGPAAAPPANPGATPAATPAPAAEKLAEGQIEQLVAPIALYPDPLLSQVLMASTYPLEVVEAARWSKDNPNVKGKALEDAMQKQSWDASVKSLAAVPQTLQMMNDKLEWTQKLGDAFLAQSQDVMDAVQKLRARADAAGNLKSTPQQKVTRARPPAGVRPPPGMQDAIMIEPVDPDFYYVPVYDPALVYGAWDYPDYPPFYWYPPGYVAVGVFGFAAGIAVGYAIWGGCDWWRGNVFVNVNRYNRFNRTNIVNSNWIHNPAHRGGVPYRNSGVANRFGSGNTPAAREALRGKLGPGSGQKNALTPRGGNRPANISRAGGGGNKQISRNRGNRQVSGGRPGGNRAVARPQNLNRAARVYARPNMGGARVQAFRGGGGAAFRGGGGGRGGGGFHGGGGRRR